MKILSYFSLCVLFFSACNQKGTDNTQQNTSPEVSIKALPVSADNNPSAKDVVLRSENDIVGLWTGAFLESDLQQQVVRMMDSISSADNVLDGDQYDLKNIKKLPLKAQAVFFKDMRYGEYDIKSPNKLSILIESINEGEVSGKSICAGNERPVTGMYTRKGNAFAFKLHEPGTEKYDGFFEFTIDLDSNSTVGIWTPANADQEPKKFELSRKEFVYAPLAQEWDWDKNFVNKNVSTQILKTKDVENQSQQHLRIIRNLIYARHGYSFKQNDIRQQFEVFPWYIPVSTDVRAQLTDTEKLNEALIKRYETYAKSYYDEFSR